MVRVPSVQERAGGPPSLYRLEPTKANFGSRRSDLVGPPQRMMVMMIGDVRIIRVHRVVAHCSVDSGPGHGRQFAAAAVPFATGRRTTTATGGPAAHYQTAGRGFGRCRTDGQHVPQIGQLLFVVLRLVYDRRLRRGTAAATDTPR